LYDGKALMVGGGNLRKKGKMLPVTVFALRNLEEDRKKVDPPWAEPHFYDQEVER
jgi:hypothetical protein